MPPANSDTMTGHRIRERRLDRGLRQAELARQVGISASYLNLIEHNRRRIGGKLLQTIAQVLEVTSQSLSEGAEAAVVDNLRVAVGRMPQGEAELHRAEDFAARFPGWAALVAAQDARINALEARVATLVDRMAHDPVLAAALHDILTSVTSIRSASSILAGDTEVDADWQRRFHRNIDDDARRLSDSSTALAAYLEDEGSGSGGSALSPAEEVAAFLQSDAPEMIDKLASAGGHISDIEEALEANSLLVQPEARALARRRLERKLTDALALPTEAVTEALMAQTPDPAALARAHGTDLATALRRMAEVPVARGARPAGLAICDGSGALTEMRPVSGFNLPRAGGSCPLWPLYRAVSVPGFPLREVVALPGAPGEQFLCFAIAGPGPEIQFGDAPVIEATMLVIPWPGDAVEGSGRPVGLGCQICPRRSCASRREPSLIAS